MGRIIPNPWYDPNNALALFGRPDGDISGYVVDSTHNVTMLSKKDGSSGYVLVGTPHNCSDFRKISESLKVEFTEKGLRTSPDVVDKKQMIAGFSWAAPRRER